MTRRQFRSCIIYYSQLLSQIRGLVWKGCWSCSSTLIARLLHQIFYNASKCNPWANQWQHFLHNIYTAACEQDSHCSTGGRPHKNRWGTKDAIPFYLLFHQALREGSPCCEREVGTNTASDRTSHLKGFLTSLASKKGLTMVSFSFFFPCLFLFLKLSLPKLWRKHAPSLLFSPAAPSLHFSVLHTRGLLFSMFGLGHLSV